MKYKVIVFDADETLFDFKKAEREAFKNTIIEFDLAYDEKLHFETYASINHAIWKELEQNLIKQSDLNVERFRRFLNKLNYNFDANEFANTYIKHLSNGSFLFDYSYELIENLSKNHKLIILTNGLTAVQENRIKKSSIANYFDDIIISEEVGIAKPNKEIFEFAFKNIPNINKSEILMIGDNLYSDIQGGINFNIDTCWYNPKKLENTSDIIPTYEVSLLEEIENLIVK